MVLEVAFLLGSVPYMVNHVFIYVKKHGTWDGGRLHSLAFCYISFPSQSDKCPVNFHYYGKDVGSWHEQRIGV